MSYIQNLKDALFGPGLEDILINPLNLDFALQDGSLVRILQPNRILELHKNPNSYLNDTNRLLYNFLNKEDNPVLVSFHLKPFLISNEVKSILNQRYRHKHTLKMGVLK